MTARKIVLETCSHSPHRDHKGAFGEISCIPCCRLAKRELPYTTSCNPGSSRVHAHATEVIPDWCPLEKNP